MTDISPAHISAKELIMAVIYGFRNKLECLSQASFSRLV